MIRAETAYDIITTLPPEERGRLYRMLEVEPLEKTPKKRKPKKKALEVNHTEIREFLIKHLRRVQQRNIEKQKQLLLDKEITPSNCS